MPKLLRTKKIITSVAEPRLRGPPKKRPEPSAAVAYAKHDLEVMTEYVAELEARLELPLPDDQFTTPVAYPFYMLADTCVKCKASFDAPTTHFNPAMYCPECSYVAHADCGWGRAGPWHCPNPTCLYNGQTKK